MLDLVTHRITPEMIPLDEMGTLSLCREMFPIGEQLFEVTLADITLTMSAKWVSTNLFFWRPLVRRGLPVKECHTFCNGLVTTKRLTEIETAIYEDVITFHKLNHGSASPDVIRAILEDLCESMNDLHTMIVTQLGSYHLSIDAFQLAELMEHPDIAALANVDISREMQIGITAAEDKIVAAGKAMMERLKDRSLPGNVLAPFIELGQLSAEQLPQVVQALGFRKEASDKIVRLPILSSYIDGIQNIKEFALDSLGAKLTVYYNKNAMPNSQYNSRKQQLLSSVIKHLYPGDCGSALTVPFLITDGNARNLIEKNIVDDGRIVRLTPRTIGNYVDKVVQLRSPLTCRHTDGVCHVCGGHLTDYIPVHTTLGIACTVEYMSRVSQLVLKAKHFSNTKSIPYVVPDDVMEVLVVKQNDIYLRNTVEVDKLKIGVPFREIHRIKELIQKSSDDDDDVGTISQQQFSTIRHAVFTTVDNDLPTQEISMVSEDGTVPYFSEEVLDYISEHPRCVSIIEDMVWITFKGFDSLREPLMRCVIQSDSMIRFNETLAKFATSKVRDFTSLSEVLAQFSDMVFRKINVNIFHLETVLKSYLITSEDDYNVPVVTDINNVRFGTLISILPRRSLGAFLAYERLGQVIADEPEIYLFGHRKGVFDSYIFPPETS